MYKNHKKGWKNDSYFSAMIYRKKSQQNKWISGKIRYVFRGFSLYTTYIYMQTLIKNAHKLIIPVEIIKQC